MSDFIEQLKILVGYTETPHECKDCASFKEDGSTDNFGPGDLCVRNIDFPFKVSPYAVCNKWVDEESVK